MGFTKYSEKVVDGDTVIVYLNVQHIYAVRIVKGKVFQTKYGALQHNDIIGKCFGTKVNFTRGWGYILFPTPELWTLTLPHRTQILYTPDISLIVTELDIGPGSVVCEAGTGSGSLSHALARTVAPDGGRLYTFDFHEIRVKMAIEEMTAHGLMSSPSGPDDVIVASHRDVCSDGFGLQNVVDAVFLDMPSPWLAIPHAVNAIKLIGGRLCSFSPCIEQVQKVTQSLEDNNFTDIQTMECLLTEFEVKQFSFPELKLPKEQDTAAEKLENEPETAEEKDSTEVLKENRKKKRGQQPPESNSESTMTVTVPPLKKPGHTGYLTCAYLPPRIL